MDIIDPRLNSPDYLPPIAYRRNAGIYELVCYVNCLVGALISENHDAISVFSRRIDEYLEKHTPGDEFEKYVSVVTSYVERHRPG
jgi:hypothetical protein